ncbi:MAG: hypothetical protein HP495_00850 [Nitrospira sp.]|nr:hypothetical protein [Nitrospira sp.]
MTTSLLVVASAGCVCTATWFRDDTCSHGPIEQATQGVYLREGIILGSLSLALAILAGARGILPFW